MNQMPETLNGWDERIAALRAGLNWRGAVRDLIRESGVSSSAIYAPHNKPQKRTALALDDACGGTLLTPPEREWAAS